MLDKIILGLLATEELTGYDVKKRIEKGIGIFYRASYGSLYPALKKLTSQGLLDMKEKPLGERRKIFYQTTAEGEKQFYQWLVSPMNVFDGTQTHLAKIYFFDRLPVDVRDFQLLQHEVNTVNYLNELKKLEKEYAELPNKACFYYKLSTLYYGISILQETLNWCRHIREGKSFSLKIEQENEDEIPDCKNRLRRRELLSYQNSFRIYFSRHRRTPRIG